MNEHEVCAVLFFSLHIKHLSQHSRPEALKVGKVQACISPVCLSLLSSVLSLEFVALPFVPPLEAKNAIGHWEEEELLEGNEWAWALSTSAPMALTF